MRKTIVCGIALLGLWAGLVACMWDNDTLAQEASRFPSTLELITGKFNRHSPEYYKWKIADRTKKLAKGDSPELYDDLAVAYSKIGDNKKAIETILVKESKYPGKYETYANLGTFYLHDGQFQKGLEYIHKAIAVNPDAHFGREKYQAKLAEYVLSRIESEGKLSLPLRGTSERLVVEHYAVGNAGFAQFLDIVATEETGNAVKGILGMMRFGQFDHPILLEALGDLLISGDQVDNASLLAARAYLKASYSAKDANAKSAYRRLAESSLYMQSNGGSDQIKFSTVESDFKRELEEADEWYSRLRQDEMDWIAAGQDVDQMFQEKYYAEPAVESTLKEPLIKLSWRGIIALLVSSTLLFLILRWMLKKLRTPRRKEDSSIGHRMVDIVNMTMAVIAAFFLILVILTIYFDSRRYGAKEMVAMEAANKEMAPITAAGMDMALTQATQNQAQEAATLIHDGKYAEASRILENALPSTIKTSGEDGLAAAAVMNDLALAYNGMGLYQQAVPLLQKALSIAEKTGGGDNKEIVRDMNNLAMVLVNVGDYAGARPLFERAAAMSVKAYGADTAQTAAAVNNLAELLRDIGDLSAARKQYQKAVSIYEKAVGPESADTARAVGNLAVLIGKQGNHIEAEKLFLQAKKIYEKTLGKDHPSYCHLLMGMADMYMDKGEYDKAGDLLNQSLETREKILGADHPDTATSKNALAQLYFTRGEHTKAEPLFRQALATREKALGLNHPSTATSLINLGFYHGTAGGNAEALQFFIRGVEAQGKVMDNVFGAATEKQKLDFAQQSAWGLDGLLSFTQARMPEDQPALRAAMSALLSRKGIVLDAQSRNLYAIAQSLDPATKEKWASLNSYRAELSRILQNKPESISAEEYKSRIAELQTVCDRQEGEISQSSAVARESLQQGEVTPAAVARRLGVGSVLLEFAKIRDYDWTKGGWGKTHRYLVFALHPDGRIELADIGDSDNLDRKIYANLKTISSMPSNQTQIKAQQNAAATLFGQIWAPIAKMVDGAENVIVSPDGAFSLVPFGALLDPDGAFLVESRIITYVTSGRDLLKDSFVNPESGLLLLANPDFGLAPQAASIPDVSFGAIRSRGFGEKFEPLPGALQEAEFIPPLLVGAGKRSLTGAEADEKTALSARRPRVLHLATHGFFLSDQQLPGATDGAEGIESSDGLPHGYENPLVRSGLALAGANNASKARSGLDGLLTALEVTGMDLHGTDLVTLSACETGAGEVKAGEGVYGLRRAFALAGARNLVMSLWPVSDTVTADQMRTFYALYGQGKSPSQALRAAQLSTIAELKAKMKAAPPSIWAPFIAQGTPAGDNKNFKTP